ncbi:MAG TPA: hypothetical protein VKJ65_03905, partial [Phycisphaerae bacterium]|nr:hypothetical protein [Phycisphaerae bacterium]
YATIETNITGGVDTGLALITNLPPFFFGNQTNIFAVTNGDGTSVVIVTNLFGSEIVTNVPAATPRDPKHPNNVWDYVPVSGTLVFNDYQMSQDIYITVNTNNTGILSNLFVFGAGNGLNAELQVALTSVTLDPTELQSIPPPTLNPTNSTTRVDIMNEWQDNFAYVPCGFFGFDVFNFERSTLGVNRDNVAHINVVRGESSDGKAANLYYEIDHKKKNDDWNTFPLQAGSDYAIPDDATKTAAEGVTDFNSVVGELQWGDGDFDPKTINITNIDNGTTEFNKDYVVQFFADSSHTWSDNAIPGNISSCTVTILYNQEPAGAVDRSYNAESVVNPDPGVNGPVYAVVVQPNNKTVIGGDFTAYDGTNSTRMARATAGGQLDETFSQNIGLGPDAFVDAIALDTNNNIYIGGGFSSFNGFERNGIARLNPNGTLDNSGFLPGNGFNGVVSAMLIQPDGRILMAGNFTTYNNTNCNYIVRLNPDGTIDPAFAAGAGPSDDYYTPDTTINSMALQTNGAIVIGGNFTSVDGVGRNYIARLNSDGSLDTTFDPGEGANDIVYSVAVDTNGFILAGGAFTQLGALGGSQGIARLNSDGSVDTSFNAGSGSDDIIYNIALQPDGGILLAGIFKSVNQTGRVGLA